MEEKKVAVVTNPNAGKNTPRAGLGRVISSILATPRWTYNPETLSALEGTAKQLGRDRPDILVIAGGDGTVHQTLSKVLLEHERSPATPIPQILIIPIGTMNNLATTLGLTKHPAVKLAESLAAKIRENRPLDVTQLNPFKINDEFGFLYGTGLPVNFLQKYYEDPKRRGPKRAIKVILATLGNEIVSLLTFRKSKQILTRPVHAKITLPEGNQPPVAPFMTHTGILCASIDGVGLGCRAMPQARSQPGCFMLRSTHLSFWGLVASLGPLWAGLPLPATFDAVVPHLTIDYQEPTIATVDGDMKPPRISDVITCGPTVAFIAG
ncbi:MAG TPA: diacylglycerol kinase family protein [Polyangia bacterium]|nr:diacylglycerol kinase family protein [Polyangia bacterium]